MALLPDGDGVLLALHRGQDRVSEARGADDHGLVEDGLTVAEAPLSDGALGHCDLLNGRGGRDVLSSTKRVDLGLHGSDLFGGGGWLVVGRGAHVGSFAENPAETGKGFDLTLTARRFSHPGRTDETGWPSSAAGGYGVNH